MKLSYQWLKELLPDLELKPNELGDLLDLKVAALERIFQLEKGLDQVIVAQVIELKPHPNADKLTLATVKANKGKMEVVCGAPNLEIGQKVPLALVGAILPSGLEIKQAKIRGIESHGMLCAEDELGMGSDHSGIMILPSHFKVGQSLPKAMKLDDTILEIENKSITRRPDLFSHLGFAREIQACLVLNKIKEPIQRLDQINNLVDQKSFLSDLEIKVQVPDLCPRYMGVIIQGIEVKPSPEWMQAKLRSSGLRPINNIVDITNLVLMETGQPLHAFDADKVLDNKGNNKNKIQIKVRMAKKGEKLLALDEEEYELTEEDLVIADQNKPIALAGIMGGQLSGISQQTNQIIIESANFDPATIRRTSWRLGLRSDAVLRFEKGLPFTFPEMGMARAIQLITELTGGKVVSKIEDEISKQTEQVLRQSLPIIYEIERASKFIGQSIPKIKTIQILEGLGCQVEDLETELKVVSPSWRPDLKMFEDLIEEVVRIYGTEKISPVPILAKLEPVEMDMELVLARKIKEILIGKGFDEVYNYSFYSEKVIQENGLDKEKHWEIANPINPDQQYLRTSLVPNLLINAELNQSNYDCFKIFEIGHIFKEQEGTKIAGLIKLRNLAKKENRDKKNKNIEALYFQIRQTIEIILKKLKIDRKELEYIWDNDKLEKNNKLSKLNKLERIIIKYNDQKIGLIGESKGFAFFELDLKVLLDLHKIGNEKNKYSHISLYPPVKRDLAFVVDQSINYFEIADEILKMNKMDGINNLIQEVGFESLEDIFIDPDKLGKNKKSLVFHLIYQSDNQTLKSEQIEEIQKKVVEEIKNKFDAKLRDF